MSRFAENTTVPSDRSRAEIEKTLMRYGNNWHQLGLVTAYLESD